MHRATHNLSVLSQIDARGLDPTTRARLAGALEDVYAAADRTLGPMLESAAGDARVLVFALHGMQRNDGWADRFGSLVDSIRRRGTASPPADGIPYRSRRRVPWGLARPLTQRLPQTVNRHLLTLWFSRMHDWSRTRLFALPCDVNGLLRVNLRGREAAGIIEPGREYESLLDELEAAFLGFRAVETGPELACDSLDLAPTLLRWMGTETREKLQGRPIPGLVP